MPNRLHASASYNHETHASAATIWAFFEAVHLWKDWNAGVHSCALDGPFATGTWMTMVLPDQEVIRSQLVEVNAPIGFTDETVLGDITVRVRHEIMPLANGNHLIVYSIEVTGEGAEEVCAQVSSDFPDVLRALVARAERAVGA
ncbi:SRPBCC family protein [Pseudomonas sp. RHF3.3-3]|uniref:Polyketide cyclase / dehydrase and lipid transport n=1 Tax=Pseudomonas asplenii TaxID=53407 RepID=A0A0N0VK87_9PSED|nr:SRPBCC family protein [Pseudomonas fuscovaginae]KPA91248.1 Polyketide cyclase / dehydrase and lipid transport [Pseudomonas fuscovaginae]